jgi:hypothetical protein
MTSNVYRLTIDGNFSEKLKSLKKNISQLIGMLLYFLLIQWRVKELFVCHIRIFRHEPNTRNDYLHGKPSFTTTMVEVWDSLMSCDLVNIGAKAEL